MSRQMKLPDDVYDRLTTMAKDNYRTYGQQITLLMDAYEGNVRGSAEVLESHPITPTPKKYEVGELFDPQNPPEIPEKKSVGQAPDVTDLLTDPEMSCCKHPTQPCKHWKWDSSTGEGYVNTLSGRYRESN